MTAQGALVVAIIVVGLVLVVLCVGLLVNKAAREGRTHGDRKRRERLEPRVLAIVNAEPFSPTVTAGVDAGIRAGSDRGRDPRAGTGKSAEKRTAGAEETDGREWKGAGKGAGAGKGQGAGKGAGAGKGQGEGKGEGPGRDAPARVEAAAGGRESAARERFRAEFGSMQARPERRVIEDILLDHAVRLRGVARERISEGFEALGFVDEYLSGLSSRRWWRRSDAAERLGLARAERALEPLVRSMSDDVPEVRLRAAKALGEIRGQAGVRPLIEALAQPNRWSALRVADILTRMGSEAAQGIKDAWPGLPPAARLASLDILGKLRRLEAGEFLCGVLRAPDPDERARAAHALGMIGDPSAVGELLQALKDQEWPVRAMAAKALGRIASPEAVEPLAVAIKDKEWWVRSNAAVALKSIGARGQSALLGVLDGADNYARHQAVLMLQESGVLDEYAASLDAPEEAVRGAAEKLIQRLIDLGRIDFLADLSREHPSFRVRARLEAMLKGQGAAS